MSLVSVYDIVWHKEDCILKRKTIFLILVTLDKAILCTLQYIGKENVTLGG